MAGPDCLCFFFPPRSSRWVGHAPAGTGCSAHGALEYSNRVGASILDRQRGFAQGYTIVMHNEDTTPERDSSFFPIVALQMHAASAPLHVRQAVVPPCITMLRGTEARSRWQGTLPLRWRGDAGWEYPRRSTERVLSGAGTRAAPSSASSGKSAVDSSTDYLRAPDILWVASEPLAAQRSVANGDHPVRT